jgi:hypothetical protein
MKKGWERLWGGSTENRKGDADGDADEGKDAGEIRADDEREGVADCHTRKYRGHHDHSSRHDLCQRREKPPEEEEKYNRPKRTRIPVRLHPIGLHHGPKASVDAIAKDPSVLGQDPPLLKEVLEVFIAIHVRQGDASQLCSKAKAHHLSDRGSHDRVFSRIATWGPRWWRGLLSS